MGGRPLGYVDARTWTIDGIVDLIEQKLTGVTRPAATLPDSDFRTPRTAGEMRELLGRRPPGWEYLMYAGVISQGVEALAEKYRDHRLRYRRPSRRYVRDTEAMEYVQATLQDMQLLLDSTNAVLGPWAQEQAFGAPGMSGDPEEIRHIGERLVNIYEQFLDIAADLRNVAVSDRFRRAFDLLASFPDQPIAEFRRFSMQFASETDRLPSYLALPDPKVPLRITLTLTLTLDERVSREFSKELDRLRRIR